MKKNQSADYYRGYMDAMRTESRLLADRIAIAAGYRVENTWREVAKEE